MESDFRIVSELSIVYKRNESKVRCSVQILGWSLWERQKKVGLSHGLISKLNTTFRTTEFRTKAIATVITHHCWILQNKC